MKKIFNLKFLFLILVLVVFLITKVEAGIVISEGSQNVPYNLSTSAFEQKKFEAGNATYRTNYPSCPFSLSSTNLVLTPGEAAQCSGAFNTFGYTNSQSQCPNFLAGPGVPGAGTGQAVYATSYSGPHDKLGVKYSPTELHTGASAFCGYGPIKCGDKYYWDDKKTEIQTGDYCASPLGGVNGEKDNLCSVANRRQETGFGLIQSRLGSGFADGGSVVEITEASFDNWLNNNSFDPDGDEGNIKWLMAQGQKTYVDDLPSWIDLMAENKPIYVPIDSIDRINKIKTDFIDKGDPVTLGLRFRSGGHAVILVGVSNGGASLEAIDPNGGNSIRITCKKEGSSFVCRSKRYGKEILLDGWTTGEDLTKSLREAKSIYCNRLNTKGDLCNSSPIDRVREFAKQVPPNFRVPSASGGNCAGWSTSLLRVAYLANFVGEAQVTGSYNTCATTIVGEEKTVPCANNMSPCKVTWTTEYVQQGGILGLGGSDSAKEPSFSLCAYQNRPTSIPSSNLLQDFYGLAEINNCKGEKYYVEGLTFPDVRVGKDGSLEFLDLPIKLFYKSVPVSGTAQKSTNQLARGSLPKVSLAAAVNIQSSAKSLTQAPSQCSFTVPVNNQTYSFTYKNGYLFMHPAIQNFAYLEAPQYSSLTADQKNGIRIFSTDSVITPGNMVWYWKPGAVNPTSALIDENFVKYFVALRQSIEEQGGSASNCNPPTVPARFQTFLNTAPPLRACLETGFGDANSDGLYNETDLACLTEELDGGMCLLNSNLLDLDDNGTLELSDLAYELQLMSDLPRFKPTYIKNTCGGGLDDPQSLWFYLNNLNPVTGESIFNLGRDVSTAAYYRPIFNYTPGQSSHRLWLNFDGLGKISAITPVPGYDDCEDLTLGGMSASTCPLNQSIVPGTKCGIYLQSKAGRCVVKVSYLTGTNTSKVKYFEQININSSRADRDQIINLGDQMPTVTLPSVTTPTASTTKSLTLLPSTGLTLIHNSITITATSVKPLTLGTPILLTTQKPATTHQVGGYLAYQQEISWPTDTACASTKATCSISSGVATCPSLSSKCTFNLTKDLTVSPKLTYTGALPDAPATTTTKNPAVSLTVPTTWPAGTAKSITWTGTGFSDTATGYLYLYNQAGTMIQNPYQDYRNRNMVINGWNLYLKGGSMSPTLWTELPAGQYRFQMNDGSNLKVGESTFFNVTRSAATSTTPNPSPVTNYSLSLIRPTAGTLALFSSDKQVFTDTTSSLAANTPVKLKITRAASSQAGSSRASGYKLQVNWSGTSCPESVTECSVSPSAITCPAIETNCVFNLTKDTKVAPTFTATPEYPVDTTPKTLTLKITNNSTGYIVGGQDGAQGDHVIDFNCGQQEEIANAKIWPASSCSKTYPHGTVVTLIASTPGNLSDGKSKTTGIFSGWGSNCTSMTTWSDATGKAYQACEIKLDSNKTISASFSAATGWLLKPFVQLGNIWGLIFGQ